MNDTVFLVLVGANSLSFLPIQGKNEEQFPKDTVGCLSVNCWLADSRLLTISRPTVGRQVTNSLMWELLFTFTQATSLALCDAAIIMKNESLLNSESRRSSHHIF